MTEYLLEVENHVRITPMKEFVLIDKSKGEEGERRREKQRATEELSLNDMCRVLDFES